MNSTILLVEDNPHIMEINSEALMMEGYTVLEAVDGRGCMEVLKERDVDLIVLDIMLPDTDGLVLCRAIRAAYDIPILFLSALGENAQIIEGLRAGGDDYLPKPYDIGVLLARIEARLRASKRRKRYLYSGGLKLDTLSMTAWRGDTDLLLTQKEFILLLTLVRSPDRPVDREELYRIAWGTASAEDHSALHTAVSRLNRKLDGAGAAVRAVSRHGEGYELEEV